MRDVHVLPAVCSAVLVLLFVETGCGQTASQEQVLSFLDELDKLAEPKSVQGNKEHFCKFFEPHLIRMSQHYKRRTVKNVQIPCAKDNSMTRCSNSRVVFEPAVREVTKKVLRRVQRCCKGWKGIRCDERDKDDSLNDKRQLSDSSSAKTCSPSCQNNGLCSNGLCFCSPGYTGRACERAVCIPNCLNGGLCVKPNQCACPNGWTGTRCSKALCTISCQNGGSCVAPNKCQCRLGYSGVTCETDFCETPCHNGGNCVAGNCSCPSGWSGNRCQTPRCLAGCANQGTCIAPEVCACVPEYTGSQCQFGISFCSGLPNGNYKDPENCYGYISCSNGVTHKMNCPSGLRFNYTINQCDWPANVPCDQGIITVEERTILATAFPTGAMNEPDICFMWRSHLKTFDGRYIYFPGRCTYKLIHDCQDDLFSVHVFTDTLCKDLKHCRRAVNLYLGGLDIKIHLGEDDQVTVGDKNVSLPHIINNVVIEKVSSYIITYGYNGITVMWDGKDSVYAHVSANHRNMTCGLCGNYNGFPDDDVMTYSRQQVSSIAKFGNSWRMTDVNDLCPNVRDEETKSPCSSVTQGNRTQIKHICSYLRNSTFFSCHVILDPAPFIKMCEEELCKCSLADRLECACSAFTQYSRACARNKAPINWRTSDLCPVTCPNTSAFTECASSCPPTCQIKKRNYICPQRCLDGCHCVNGTVYDGQRCVPVQQCPCIHNKQHFTPNSVIKRDCNNCTCANGRWICTTLQCPGVCSASGDPHYRTFDGLQFSFMGGCQYILAKDCVNNAFTVLVDNVKCGSGGTVSCTKNVYVHLNGTIITLRGGGTVTIDGNKVPDFPRVASNYIIRQLSSSMTSVNSPVGITVMWDGISRVYVTVQPRFRGMSCGLCGTFNSNQNDDLTTKENVVETRVTAFGNSWKVNPSCNDTKPSRHPCEVQIQRKAMAEKLCTRLLQAPFNKCHHTVDPRDGYVANCMFDVCGCQKGTQCLCNAIAAYVHDCARHGVIIDWINSQVIPECNVVCSIPGQLYQVCGSSCQQTCREISMDLPCKEECVEGCNCPVGRVLRYDNQCVPFSRCPCYRDGRAYDPGTLIKPTNCTECLCKDGRFVCSNKSCAVCPPGQKWVPCGAQCAKTCDNFHLPCLDTTCQEGCVCPEGRVLHGQQCINSSQCLCHHGGRSYRPGQKIKMDCNTCSCKGTQWSCTNQVCPGTCSVYGELNYITFDGRRYTFSGACEYVLVQDSCNGSSVGTFQIQVQNVPCGSSGLTCTKKVSVIINNTVIVLEREKKPVVSPLPGSAGPRVTSSFQIRELHFFTVLETQFGLTVTWDRGTRLYVTLDPKYKGRTCGLCGNFNGDRNDDFMTPQMLPETLANDFGDSWKVESSCPDAIIPKNPCATSKHRAPWAHKMCSVIRRDVFKPCHDVVDPDPWYDACYRDACACDSGGDCECLCTAIAAYGHECCKHGVSIKWRTQELCPIQCPRKGGSCSEYTACDTAYPQTCGSLCDATPAECPVRLEGCSCPNGTVLSDGRCISPRDCPCHVGGVDYKPGSIIVKNCQRCSCESGCLSCTGPTCPTPGTTASASPETWTTTISVATSKIQTTSQPPTTTKPPGISTTYRLTGTMATTAKSPETMSQTTTKSSGTTTTIKSTTATTKPPRIKITNKLPGTTATASKSSPKSAGTTTNSPGTIASSAKSSKATQITSRSQTAAPTTSFKSPGTTSEIPRPTETTRAATTAKSPETLQTTSKLQKAKTTVAPSKSPGTSTSAPETTVITMKSTAAKTTTSKFPGTTTTKSPETTSRTTTSKSSRTTSNIPETTTMTAKSSETITTTINAPDTTTTTSKSPATTTTFKSPAGTSNVPETTTISTKLSQTKTTTTTSLKTLGTTTTSTSAGLPATTKAKIATVAGTKLLTTSSTGTKAPRKTTATTLSKVRGPTTTRKLPGITTTSTLGTRKATSKSPGAPTTIKSPNTTTTTAFKVQGPTTAIKLPETTTTSSPGTTKATLKSPGATTTTTTTTTTTSSPGTTTITSMSPTFKPPRTTTTIKSPPTTATTTSKSPPIKSREATTTSIAETTTLTSKSPKTTSKSPVTSPQTVIIGTTTPSCPQNMMYTPCKSRCEETCQYMNNTCTLPPKQSCYPGCHCPDGTVFNGTRCVRPADCICLFNGTYYDPGSTWNSTCERCWCWNNSIICRALRCPSLMHCPSDDFVALTLPGECCQTCVRKNYTTCLPPKFRCKDGKCIKKHWLCDGQKDCRDGEDERNCTRVSACFQPLGLSNNSIPDNFFGASSSIDVYYRPGEGRLNNSHVVGRGSGAWCSGSDDKAPYLQVNLGSVRKVTQVSTQGHPVLHKWVTLFRLSYSLNGVIWTKLDKNFPGNTNQSTIVTNKLPQPIVAQYIRVYAEQWYLGVCLRVEFYGCAIAVSPPATTTTPTTPAICSEFRCQNGRCIDLSLQCDGEDDCGDYSDEVHCGNGTCKEFRCNNSKCISYKSLCDGHQDCTQGEDEDNCPTAPSTTGSQTITNATKTTGASSTQKPKSLTSTLTWSTKLTSLTSEAQTSSAHTSPSSQVTTQISSSVAGNKTTVPSTPPPAGTTVAPSGVCPDECTCYMNCGRNIVCPFDRLCSHCTCSNETIKHANRCVVPMPLPCVRQCEYKGKKFQVGTSIQNGLCHVCTCQRKPNTLDQSEVSCQRTCPQSCSKGFKLLIPENLDECCSCQTTQMSPTGSFKETTLTNKAQLKLTTQELNLTSTTTTPSTLHSTNGSTTTANVKSPTSKASTQESSTASTTQSTNGLIAITNETRPTARTSTQETVTTSKASSTLPVTNANVTRPTTRASTQETTAATSEVPSALPITNGSSTISNVTSPTSRTSTEETTAATSKVPSTLPKTNGSTATSNVTSPTSRPSTQETTATSKVPSTLPVTNGTSAVSNATSPASRTPTEESKTTSKVPSALPVTNRSKTTSNVARPTSRTSTQETTGTPEVPSTLPVTNGSTTTANVTKPTTRTSAPETTTTSKVPSTLPRTSGSSTTSNLTRPATKTSTHPTTSKISSTLPVTNGSTTTANETRTTPRTSTQEATAASSKFPSTLPTTNGSTTTSYVRRPTSRTSTQGTTTTSKVPSTLPTTNGPSTISNTTMPASRTSTEESKTTSISRNTNGSATPSSTSTQESTTTPSTPHFTTTQETTTTATAPTTLLAANESTVTPNITGLTSANPTQELPTTSKTTSVPTTTQVPLGCVWSNCSCPMTCADLAENAIIPCTNETCSPGWKCPPSVVLLRSKWVSPVLECPCYHNNTFYKTGEKFENGSCSSCMCLGDSVVCTQTCNIKSCSLGEELVDEPGKCCFCRKRPTNPARNFTTTTTIKNVQTTPYASTLRKIITPKTTTFTAKEISTATHQTTAGKTSTSSMQTTSEPESTTTTISSNTKPNVSTQPSTPSVLPTAGGNIELCNVHTENKSIIDEFGCSNSQPIRQTSCQGFCKSKAVANISLPFIHVECLCCKPKNLTRASVSMKCPDDRSKVFNYAIITECSCVSCESTAYESKLRTVMGARFGNTTTQADSNILN